MFRRLNTFLKDYFFFPRKQRNGILVLVFILLAVISIPYVYPLLVKDKPIDTSKFDKDVKDFLASIKEDTGEAVPLSGPESVTNSQINESNTSPKTIEINSADSLAFVKLYGIGPVLAARIVKFRNKLGGFYSVDQLKEVYGLKPETFDQIKARLKVDAATIRRINLNSATKDELKSHPYIGYSLANVIVNYRDQHGDFKSVEDVKNIKAIDDSTYKKLQPYLSIK